MHHLLFLSRYKSARARVLCVCVVFVCACFSFLKLFGSKKRVLKTKKTVNPKQAQTEKKKVSNTKTESTCTFA